jgi:hypothetical protein
MLTVEERAQAVLAAIGQHVDTRAASGRYRRSKPIRPGIRYWTTARLRQREDVFGVQFHGPALSEALRLRAAFERANFEIRNPETSKITYARPIPFGPDENLDAEALAEAKRAADAILGTHPAPGLSTMSFLEFMQASPLAGVELDLPPRTLQADGAVDLVD